MKQRCAYCFADDADALHEIGCPTLEAPELCEWAIREWKAGFERGLPSKPIPEGASLPFRLGHKRGCVSVPQTSVMY